MVSVSPSAESIAVASVSVALVVSTSVAAPSAVAEVTVADAGSSATEKVACAVDDVGKPLSMRRYALNERCAADSLGSSGGLRCVPSPPANARSFGVGTTGGEASGLNCATEVGGGGVGVGTGGSQPSASAQPSAYRNRGMCDRSDMGCLSGRHGHAARACNGQVTVTVGADAARGDG